MDEIRLDTVYVRDIDNDRLVFDLDNALPSGLEIAEIVDQDGPRLVIRGTPEPGTAGMTSHTITVTDIAGEQLVMTPFTVTVTDSAVVPDVVGDDLATAIAAVAATGLQVASIAYAGIVDGTDEGDIFAIAPPPGTQLTPGAGVALSVAGWQFTAYSDVLLNNTDSPIEENAEVNYRLYADGDVDSPDYRDPDDKNTAIVDADGRILLKSNIAADTWVEVYKVNADRSRSEIWSGRVEFG
jgi:beta-lactam-binding protein with PASTA domain